MRSGHSDFRVRITAPTSGACLHHDDHRCASCIAPHRPSSPPAPTARCNPPHLVKRRLLPIVPEECESAQPDVPLRQTRNYPELPVTNLAWIASTPSSAPISIALADPYRYTPVILCLSCPIVGTPAPTTRMERPVVRLGAFILPWERPQWHDANDPNLRDSPATQRRFPWIA